MAVKGGWGTGNGGANARSSGVCGSVWSQQPTPGAQVEADHRAWAQRRAAAVRADTTRKLALSALETDAKEAASRRAAGVAAVRARLATQQKELRVLRMLSSDCASPGEKALALSYKAEKQQYFDGRATVSRLAVARYDARRRARVAREERAWAQELASRKEVHVTAREARMAALARASAARAAAGGRAARPASTAATHRAWHSNSGKGTIEYGSPTNARLGSSTCHTCRNTGATRWPSVETSPVPSRNGKR